MAIKIYPWLAGSSELRERWADCVKSGGYNPSLHPGWMDITLEAPSLQRQASIVHVSAPDAGELFVPLVTRTISIGGMPLRCLDLVGNVVSYHAELIAKGNLEPLLRELLTSRQLPAYDVLRLGNLPIDGSSLPIVNRLLNDGNWRSLSYPGQQSPYVAIDTDWTGYLPKLSKKMRANITRCIRTTQQAGDSSMVWYTDASAIDRLMADILAVEARSWKAADNKAIKEDSIEQRYYRHLLPWLAEHGLLANVLYVNQAPCAYVLCSTWNGWVGQLKTSFDQSVRDAGFRVIQASIERAYSDGAKEYDFLGDAAPHKLRWTDKIREHEDKWIFAPHLRASLLFHLKRRIDAWRARRAPKAAEPAAEQD
jgi:hypothetical protein